MSTQENLRASQIVVVGAGNMGAGIAQKYAMHGHLVTIIDKVSESLARARKSIATSLEQGVARNVFAASEAYAIQQRISFTTELSAARNADLVIEAIFENLLLKQELFVELDKICPANTVLATNTSSLKVAHLQQGLCHPKRVVGLHYFFPPARNRLVEIISTDLTSKATHDRVKDWQVGINKTVIECRDSPGFVVNRFFVPWLNESLRIVHEGRATIATVEKAAQEFFSIGMGPFALMNATGLPITLHSCDALASALGSFYAPCPLIAWQIEKKAAWDLSGMVDESALSEIGRRLLTVVAVVCYQMVDHEHVCSAQDVDIGAQVGLLWKKGPFELLKEHRSDVWQTLKHMQQHNLLLPSTEAFEQNGRIDSL